MPLILTVFGAALDSDNQDVLGSYRGTVIASVPEPGSWALGLGVSIGSGATIFVIPEPLFLV